jgi:glutathione S-transferase
MPEVYQLYGMSASLYMGKVRSYLRKQHIPFVERVGGDPYFAEKIVPAVGRMIMPVLETSNGTLIQDGADIIDFFEQQADANNESMRLPAYPSTGVARAAAYLFELFGGEGMLRPAMHYRWNFDETNLSFLKNDFMASLFPSADVETAEKVFDFASKRMRAAAVAFGVTPESIPLIEQSYAEFLDLFSTHLKSAPYWLGGRPTIGDYGLIAPLFAHLARDPYPSLQMREYAPEVFRYVERMNSPAQVLTDGFSAGENLFSDDAMPATLKNLMRYVAQEYLPELRAQVQFANEWIDKNVQLETGTNGLKKPESRVIGNVEFDWRGISLKTSVMPYRFYLLQRLQDSVMQASPAEQRAITDLFSETGLLEILDLTTYRRVERVNYMEVWGPDLRVSD